MNMKLILLFRKLRKIFLHIFLYLSLKLIFTTLKYYILKNNSYILNLACLTFIEFQLVKTMMTKRIFAFRADYVISFIRKHVQKFKAELTVMQPPTHYIKYLESSQLWYSFNATIQSFCISNDFKN